MKLNVKVPESVGFQLAAMLDIVFLLLIFFVVTQRFVLSEQDLDVKVPSAQKNDENFSYDINEIIINVREDPETHDLLITVDRQIYRDVKDLYARLKRQADLNPQQTVRIRGDVNLRWELMAKVIQTCTEAGIMNVSFSEQMIRTD